MTPFTPGIVSPTKPSPEDLIFRFDAHRLRIEAEAEWVRIPRRGELPASRLAQSNALYLGHLGERACFAEPADDTSGDDGTGPHWQSLRALFGRIDDTCFAVAGRAYQILQWDLTHRFCGRCGTPTEAQRDERARRCPTCELSQYPRVSPAIMALVVRGRELLLARSPHFPPEMFSALAGFVEPGESLEDTLIREVREEVGIEICNLRYFGSQPWPFPHSLMIAFVAEHADGDIQPQDGEIEAAGWFDIDALPRLPHRISIARQLIEAAVIDRRVSLGAVSGTLDVA